MQNIEVIVCAIALLITTANIYIYSWFENRVQYLHIGIRVMRLTAAFPALVLIVWTIYILLTDKDSPLAMALLTSSLALVASAVQLLSLLIRKQPISPGKTV